MTEVSRREVTGGDASVAAARAGRDRGRRRRGAALGRSTPAARVAARAVGAYAAAVGRAHADAIRDPSPARLQRAVGAGIMGLIPLEAGLLAGAGSFAPAAGIASLWPLGPPCREAESGHVSLRYGYVSNGLADHRIEDALELLAENGYAGVALTLDHIHFDPFAPRLRARAARLRAELEELGLSCVVETGARFILDPRRKHFPTLVSDGRQRRVDLLCRAVDVAVELGAPVVSMWSGAVAPDEDRERAWDLLVDGCAARGRARRGQRRSRSPSSRSPACWSRRSPTTRSCSGGSGTRRRSGSRSTSATSSASSRCRSPSASAAARRRSRTSTSRTCAAACTST